YRRRPRCRSRASLSATRFRACSVAAGSSSAHSSVAPSQPVLSQVPSWVSRGRVLRSTTRSTSCGPTKSTANSPFTKRSTTAASQSCPCCSAAGVSLSESIRRTPSITVAPGRGSAHKARQEGNQLREEQQQRQYGDIRDQKHRRSRKGVGHRRVFEGAADHVHVEPHGRGDDADLGRLDDDDAKPDRIKPERK